MAAPRASAAHASVVFLKIAEFTHRPVEEQVRLKGVAEGAVAAALACLREVERIVLEAADGAAVVVLGNPAAALEFARRATAGEPNGALMAGISHGPVRVAGASSSPIVLGDGIVMADAAAGFAPRGRIAATREYRDALVRIAPDAAAHLIPAGTHNDARDRSYEIFVADEKAGAARRGRVLALGGVAAIALLAAGIAVRLDVFAPKEPAGPAKAEAPGKALAIAKPALSAPKGSPEPPAMATVRLDIKPRGEVRINGVAKGTSPPLTSIQIAPGRHTIEIRHGRATPLVLQVHAGPGEELAIKHAFAPPPAPKPAWRRWIDQVTR